MKAIPLFTLSAGLSLVAFAAEAKLKVDELPPAVQTALKDQTKDATIVGASKEREHGRSTYEVETKLDGKDRDLTFAEDGSLLEIEQEVDLNSIPGPAKRAIEKRLSGGTITKVESVTKGPETSYEALVRSKSGKTHEVAVNMDGSAHRED